MGWRKIGVVASVPAAGVEPGTGAAALAFRADLGNVLEITAKNANAGASTLTLLRWFPPPAAPAEPGTTTLNMSGEWREWAEDRPIVLRASATSSGRYELPRDSLSYWLLLVGNAGIVADVTADAQVSPYRGGP